MIFLVKEVVAKRLSKKRMSPSVNAEKDKLLKEEETDFAEIKAQDTKVCMCVWHVALVVVI